MAGMRSPNYPTMGLSDAIGLARGFWNKEKRTAVPSEVAAKAIGYKSLSGPARTGLAALKTYGLTEKDRQGIRLSDLALRILHNPQGSEDYNNAVKDAALRPTVFREFYESHARASDDALRAYLITKKGFSEPGANQFIKAFRSTLALANPAEFGQDASKGSMGDEAMASALEVNIGKPAGQMVQEVFRWPLPDGVQAELRLIGGQLTPSNVDAIAQYLETVKKVLKAPAKS